MTLLPSPLKQAGRLILLSALLALSIFGCAPVPDCARPSVICVGLVTDLAGLQDGSLSQTAWEGIQRARREGLIAHAAYIETNESRDYDRNIAYFARRHYDVILTSGHALQDDTLHYADQYADTVFIGLDQPLQAAPPNVIFITVSEDQIGFLAGALAAQLTQTGIVAAVCETKEIVENWRICEGFRVGALYMNREVKVLLSFHEASHRETLYADPQWGREAAQKLIAQGADVLFASGGGTGQGAILGAAEVGVLAIGAEQDQFYVTPEASDVLLTSVVKNADSAVYTLLRQMHNGETLPQEMPGTVTLAPYHNRAGFIPETVQRKMLELEQALASGALQTGVPRQPPP
jgi:basic membrane protein A